MTLRQPTHETGNMRDGASVRAFLIERKAEFTTSSHSHACGQMIGCSQGVVTISTDGGAWIVPPGHALWLPPYQSHGGQSFGAATGWTLYVTPSACAALPPVPRTVTVPPLLREAVIRAASWPDESMDRSRQRIADLILAEIAALRAEPLDLAILHEPRLRRIALALLEQPADGRSVREWAMWAGVTTRTLSRRFPQETGQTFVAWRQRVRLMRAVEMLAEGHSVTMIAIDLGYSSVSAFIALFRHTFGVTPTGHPALHRCLDRLDAVRAT